MQRYYFFKTKKIILHRNADSECGTCSRLWFNNEYLPFVVFFNNTELNELINKNITNVQDVYDQTIAEKFAFEKRLIVNELKKYGIYSVLTQPEHLTLDTINKYLEIKSRGIL